MISVLRYIHLVKGRAEGIVFAVKGICLIIDMLILGWFGVVLCVLVICCELAV